MCTFLVLATSQSALQHKSTFTQSLTHSHTGGRAALQKEAKNIYTHSHSDGLLHLLSNSLPLSFKIIKNNMLIIFQ